MQSAVGALTEEFDDFSDLVLVFGSRDQLTADDFVPQLTQRFPESIIAGCSTAGQFQGVDLVDDQPLITTLHFEHSTIRSATAPIKKAELSGNTGRTLGRELHSDDLVAVLVLSDGTHCNGCALIAGLALELDSKVTIFGGLAADADRFIETVVIADGRADSKQVVAIGFYGDRLKVSTGSEGGCEIFGPERTITSSKDNVLYELDGEPALELYSRYLGDRAQELPSSALLFPLAISAPDSDAKNTLVRTILGVDFEKSSMTFAGNIPQGWKAQLMRASSDGLIDGAERAGANLQANIQTSGSSLCLGVSCVGRRLVLGQRTDEEIEAVAELLEPHVNLIGFYSYGELAPGLSGRCELHNQTMTLTVISEV